MPVAFRKNTAGKITIEALLRHSVISGNTID